MKFCSQCGSARGPSDKFCGSCGKPFLAAPSAEPDTEIPAEADKTAGRLLFGSDVNVSSANLDDSAEDIVDGPKKTGTAMKVVSVLGVFLLVAIAGFAISNRASSLNADVSIRDVFDTTTIEVRQHPDAAYRVVYLEGVDSYCWDRMLGLDGEVIVGLPRVEENLFQLQCSRIPSGTSLTVVGDDGESRSSQTLVVGNGRKLLPTNAPQESADTTERICDSIQIMDDAWYGRAGRGMGDLQAQTRKLPSYLETSGLSPDSNLFIFTKLTFDLMTVVFEFTEVAPATVEDQELFESVIEEIPSAFSVTLRQCELDGIS